MEAATRINGQGGGFAGVGQVIASGIGIGDRHRIKVAGTTTGADRGKLVAGIGQINSLPGSEGHQVGVSGHAHGVGLGNVTVRKHRQGTVGTTGEVQHATGIHCEGACIAAHVHCVNVGNAGRSEAAGTRADQIHRAEIIAPSGENGSDVRVIRGQGGGARHRQRAALADVATGGAVQGAVGTTGEVQCTARVGSQGAGIPAHVQGVSVGNAGRGKAAARVHQRHGTKIISAGAQVSGNGGKCGQRGGAGNRQRAALGDVAIGLHIQGGIAAASQIQHTAIRASGQRTDVTADGQGRAVADRGAGKAAGSAKYDIVEVVGGISQRHSDRVGIGIQICLPGNNNRVQARRMANVARRSDIQAAGANIAKRYAASTGQADGIGRVQRDTGQIDQAIGIKADGAGAAGVDGEAEQARIGDGSIPARNGGAVGDKADRIARRQSNVVRVQELDLTSFQQDRRTSAIDHVNAYRVRWTTIGKVDGRHIAVQRSASVNDLQHFRIQQQGAEGAVGCGQVNAAVKTQILLARNFSKTTIASVGSAGSAQAAVEPGDFIGPDDNATTVTIVDGISGQRRITNEGARSIAHIRVAALIVTADQNLTATIDARRVNHGTVINADLVAQHLNAATLTQSTGSSLNATGYQRGGIAVDHDIAAIALCARHINCTGMIQGTAASGQEYLTVALFNTGCLDNAFVVNDRCCQITGRTGGHVNTTTFGINQVVVRHQTINHCPVYFQTNQAIAGEIHGNTIAGSKRHGTKTGTDNAFVNGLTAEQGNIAAIRSNQLTLVDHIAASTFEQVVTGKEIFIRHVQRGCNEASCINTRARRKQDAGLVDQENVTTGIDRTENIRGVIPHHPVQHHVAAILQEVDRVTGSDTEIVPVNHQIRGMLVNSQRVRITEDVCITMGNIFPCGEIHRIGTHAECHCQQCWRSQRLQVAVGREKGFHLPFHGICLFLAVSRHNVGNP